MPNDNTLTVAVAQIAPVWLDREATVQRVVAQVDAAAMQGARLIAFGEALLPGYPFWVEHTDGARFESDFQKTLYARYAREAVDIARGDLALLCEAARRGHIQVMLGIIERPADRGGHSLYCAQVTIDDQGQVRNVHRKLMPTHEERLVWAPGDGHGLRVLALDGFAVGGLNCWENWMPLARSALYAQGINVHVACWPGNVRNTADITRFIAREGRCYVLSVSGLMRRSDVPADIPHAGTLRAALPDVCADGGSCIAGPDGQWLLEPQVSQTGLWLAELSLATVRAERQSFDPFGHYSRPDVLELQVNRARPTGVRFADDE
ncbi:MAG: carbon-nitrogen hydrolase [Gammaproteobacteria bacterium HGW-Gammaproteobacteria-4]|jgi:nitrilase|nr:MAG: carbon-nitrogen hydrolase [Gammaproteobacteria bacterium HGW-Gammaproteobacteria-4]